ncbi:glycosyltransferase family 2 protein [Candidatus Obscuribacterales bacterium]|jgi:dolichol-phosphate mannosyltransferase|nr:glycosyltransferase family 2 protein [Candidatus Obscuribacterales bacterium]MBX3153837.1 glycosyltransferase family 2 protein [Candidatus Obscuribacterales bacterium]
MPSIQYPPTISYRSGETILNGVPASVQTPAKPGEVDLSIIIPVCNEEDTIQPLYDQTIDALSKIGCTYELLFIDDGSTDRSYELIKQLWVKDSNVRVLKFARNYGKTPALSAGHDYARGKIILHIDADLQNDPKDISRLLDKLNEGYDVVSGWRKKRHDELFLRLIPSWIANRLISKMTGVKLSDYGCCLKAYRREVIQDVKLYGEMHRFVPIYATWLGAKVAEIPVIHHPRRFGQSKYGISRTFKVVLDLITVTFMSNYLTKPIYVFGSIGGLSMLGSFAAFALMVILRLFYDTHFIDTPLPVLTTMLFMVGVQCILMGLMAELLIRTYHESQDKRTYAIHTVLESQSFQPEE